MRRLLADGEADLVRDCRRTFDDAAHDESLWSAWVDAWIDAAYEQNHARLIPADFGVAS